MKLEIRWNGDGELAATGVSKKGGAVDWDGDEKVLGILESFPVPPGKKGHLKFVEAYFSRSTTMSLYKKS